MPRPGARVPDAPVVQPRQRQRLTPAPPRPHQEVSGGRAAGEATGAGARRGAEGTARTDRAQVAGSPQQRAAWRARAQRFSFWGRAAPQPAGVATRARLFRLRTALACVACLPAQARALWPACARACLLRLALCRLPASRACLLRLALCRFSARACLLRLAPCRLPARVLACSGSCWTSCPTRRTSTRSTRPSWSTCTSGRRTRRRSAPAATTCRPPTTPRCGAHALVRGLRLRPCARAARRLPRRRARARPCQQPAAASARAGAAPARSQRAAVLCRRVLLDLPPVWTRRVFVCVGGGICSGASPGPEPSNRVYQMSHSAKAREPRQVRRHVPLLSRTVRTPVCCGAGAGDQAAGPAGQGGARRRRHGGGRRGGGGQGRGGGGRGRRAAPGELGQAGGREARGSARQRSNTRGEAGRERQERGALCARTAFRERARPREQHV